MKMYGKTICSTCATVRKIYATQKLKTESKKYGKINRFGRDFMRIYVLYFLEYFCNYSV